MGCCTAPLKCILFLINIIFWAAGAFLLYAGVRYIQSNDGSLAYHEIWPAVIIFASAGVLIFGGLIGCIGTAMEKKTCLGVFLLLLIIVMVIQVCATGVMLAKKDDALNTFDNFIHDQFTNYGNDTDIDSDFNATSFVDSSQGNWKCCGYYNYTDWENSTWSFDEEKAPLSCCRVGLQNATCTGNLTDPELLYTEGCRGPINDAFQKVYDLLAYTALALAILLFLGSLIVIVLLYRQRNKPLGYSQLTPGYTEA